jgi:hypothetical protein
MSERGDVLVEIADEQLPQLAALYEERAPWAPYMVSFVHTAMKWKQSEKFRDSITFWSPNDTWKSDGTIVANISVRFLLYRAWRDNSGVVLFSRRFRLHVGRRRLLALPSFDGNQSDKVRRSEDYVFCCPRKAHVCDTTIRQG